MEKKKQKYDCVVIGGGPAGMIAAIRAGEIGASVLLLEKNESLGKKLLLTGDGRCNLSHKEKNNKEFVKNYGKYGDYLLSSFFVFGPEQVFQFFEKNGLKLTIEEDGRIFPQGNKSKDVLGLLLRLLKRNKVEIRFNSEVKDFVIESKKIKKVILSDKEEITADNFILTTGGKSFPITGSDGSGIEIAKSIGHSISSISPALSPIRLKDEWVKKLSGNVLKDAGIKFFQADKCILKGKGDILFTHFGISGPLVLNLSNELNEYFKKGKVDAYVDIFPNLKGDSLNKELNQILETNKNKTVKNVLSSYIGEKIALHMLRVCNIDIDKKSNSLKKEEMNRLSENLKNLQIHPYSLLGFDKAMGTKGGISLNEIDAKTMKSKIISNLFFAGELIDLIGNCGGYNLQLCWTTGYLAGNSIKLKSSKNA